MSDKILSTHRFRAFSLVFLSVLPFVGSRMLLASEKSQKDASILSTKAEKKNEPYCGLYCAYAAMKLCSVEVPFQDLLKLEYIGSPDGSSLGEIKKALEDYGMYAVAVGGLTSADLRRCPYPVILHVRFDSGAGRRGISRRCDHFVLYLGSRKDEALLLDPPYPAEWVPFHNLAPRWNGSGVIVGARPVNMDIIASPARRQLALYGAICITGVLLVRGIGHRLSRSTRTESWARVVFTSLGQGTGLAFLSLLVGMSHHGVKGEGFLAHSGGAASVQRAYRGTFIPKLSVKDVHRLLNTATTFIDARLLEDYTQGHLANAIHVPVSDSEEERRRRVADIDKNGPIVVYCQSAGCKYAESVAITLIENGFRHVAVFKGGWNEWVATNDARKR